MSKDSKREKKNIFELIEEMCPDGVEYRKIGDIAEIRTGKGITKKDMSEDGPYPIISGGKEPMGFYHEKNRNSNTVTVARAGTAGYVSFMTQDFYLNDKCFSVIPKDSALTPKYLYYALKNSEDQLTGMKSKGTVPTINTAKLGSFEIPVPPLAVQREVVRVLDTMTELTTKLTAELTARTKQYTYYRDELLELEGVEGVEYKRLGDIGKFFGGLTGKNKYDFDNGNALFATYKNVYANPALDIRLAETVSISPGEKQNALAYGDIIFTGSSETPDECGLSSVVTEQPEDSIYLNSFCFFLRLNEPDMLCPDFAKHLFRSSSIRRQIVRTANGVTRFNVSKEKMKNVLIPIPPIEAQKDIASKLDAFSSYCTDLTTGLPAEITAREKQYAYYRDLLLSFQSVQHSLF